MQKESQTSKAVTRVRDLPPAYNQDSDVPSEADRADVDTVEEAANGNEDPASLSGKASSGPNSPAIAGSSQRQGGVKDRPVAVSDTESIVSSEDC